MMNHLTAAYLDPGTGSLVIQAMIAAVVGSLIVFKSFWKQLLYRLRCVFSGRKSVPVDSTDEETS